ncbi:uncharacterized protein ACRADG_010278 [Cochliomyia hominivorax]
MFYFSNKIRIVIFSYLFTLTLQYNATLKKRDCNGISSEMTQDCCRLPNIYTKEVKETCKIFIQNSNPLENYFMLGLQEEHFCYTLCALNEMKILENGSLNNENMLIYIKEALHDTPEMIAIAANSLIKCFANTEDLRKQLIKPMEGFCSREAIFIIDCIYITTYMSCIGSAWSNTKECNNRRDYIRRCTPKGVLWN